MLRIGSRLRTSAIAQRREQARSVRTKYTLPIQDTSRPKINEIVVLTQFHQSYREKLARVIETDDTWHHFVAFDGKQLSLNTNSTVKHKSAIVDKTSDLAGYFKSLPKPPQFVKPVDLWEALRTKPAHNIEDIAKHIWGGTSSPYRRIVSNRIMSYNWVYFNPTERDIWCPVSSEESQRRLQIMKAMNDSAGLQKFIGWWRFRGSKPGHWRSGNKVNPEMRVYIDTLKYVAELDPNQTIPWVIFSKLLKPLRLLYDNLFENLVKIGVYPELAGGNPPLAIEMKNQKSFLAGPPHLVRPIPATLSPTTITEQDTAERMLSEINKNEKADPLPRVKLDETVFAIDSPDTSEVDDAVGCRFDKHGNFWVHIHVADLERVMKPKDSWLGENRISTVYKPDGAVPMLPKALVEAVSLDKADENGFSNSFAFFGRLNTDGSIKEYAITSSKVRVKRMTYKEVEHILTKKKDTPLHYMLQVAQLRKKFRNEAEQSRMPKHRVTVNEQGTVSLTTETYPLSQLLVQELMIVAGEIAGTYAVRNKVPVPYRVQDEPLEGYEKVPTDQHPWVYSSMSMQYMQRARHDNDVSKHHSMNLPNYVRVTSPIRRFADYLAHVNIKAHMRHKQLNTAGDVQYPFSNAVLSHTLPWLDVRDRHVRNIQRVCENQWKNSVIVVDRNYDGVVIMAYQPRSDQFHRAASRQIYRVCIPELGMEVTVNEFLKSHQPLLYNQGEDVNMRTAFAGNGDNKYIVWQFAPKVEIVRGDLNAEA